MNYRQELERHEWMLLRQGQRLRALERRMEAVEQAILELSALVAAQPGAAPAATSLPRRAPAGPLSRLRRLR